MKKKNDNNKSYIQIMVDETRSGAAVPAQSFVCRQSSCEITKVDGSEIVIKHKTENIKKTAHDVITIIIILVTGLL